MAQLFWLRTLCFIFIAITVTEAEQLKLLEAIHHREQELLEREEELMSQKEELTAAIEQLVKKNDTLNKTLKALYERNFELDQILYRASHDLRSPIVSIQGILSLINQEILPERASEYLEHLDIQATNMVVLVDALKALAEVNSDSLNIKSFDIKALIEEIIIAHQHFQGFNNVKVIVEVNIDNFIITSNKNLLYIILTQLISNAYTFRDSKKLGEIMIKVGSDEETCHILIAEDGEGISGNIKGKIFDMFYRGSERSRGNGLGLFIAKKAVDRLNGSITMYMKENKTCAEVSIPLTTT